MTEMVLFHDDRGRTMDLPAIKLLRSAFELICLGALVFAVACTDSTSASYTQPTAQSDQLSPQTSSVPQEIPVASLDTSLESNAAALENLWKTRVVNKSTDTPSTGFTLGPGDLLRISVPQIPQLTNRTFRVSEQNTISLPLLGEINVSGMTQQDLLNDLSNRTRKYVYHPQVEVFLLRSENREVAVLGSVKKPGRYMLTSRSDTIMTMISRAGGLNTDAAAPGGGRILLIPASATKEQSLEHSGSPASAPPGLQTAGARGSGVAPVALRDPVDLNSVAEQKPAEEVVISTSRAEDQRYLELPAAPGDVLVVPAAGGVTVQGWVDKPGAFPITSGMTVLGSIAAAGGPMFSSAATLLREQRDGHKLEVALDLNKMKHGEQPDLPVQGGDIVVVERSAAGAVPYAVYFLVEHIGIGMGLSAS
jgi:protein involved in polysaccharide export with SLBB domain